MNKKAVAVLALSTLLVAGCSSSKRTTTTSVTRDSLTHTQLDQKILEVKRIAEAAGRAANQANLTAQDAKAMSIKTEEKLNRVFRKSQMK